MLRSGMVYLCCSLTHVKAVICDYQDVINLMKVNVEQIGIYEADEYFRVFVKRDTHTMHSEKLNKETAEKLLAELLLE